MMKKIILLALVAFLVAGCGEKAEEKVDPEKLFKEQISTMLNIENESGKDLMQDMSSEAVTDIVTNIMQNELLSAIDVNYGSESQGIGTNINGDRILCYKLPVEFSFDGMEENINAFVEEVKKISSRVSVSKFDVTEKDGKYNVNAVINFLGDMASTKLSGNSGVNLQKKAVETEEEGAIVLRDFDVNLTIRPSNSDASAISLGVKNDTENVLYEDSNKVEGITVNFSKQGNKISAEYKSDSGESKQASFVSTGDIKFDILSCKKELEDDYVGVNLTINNTSGKKVSVIIYNDKGDRVNIVGKSGNVEVSEK